MNSIEILIQEPAAPVSPGMTLGQWYDPALQSIADIPAIVDCNRCMGWSDALSRTKDESGVVWDGLPALESVGRRVFGTCDVVRIGICRVDESSRVWSDMTRSTIRKNYEYSRELTNIRQVVYAISMRSNSLADEPKTAHIEPTSYWQYAVILKEKKSLFDSLDRLSADQIGFPDDLPNHINLINKHLMTALLKLGIVVLLVSDKRYAKFPVLYSRQKIGASALAGYRDVYESATAITDVSDWRAF